MLVVRLLKTLATPLIFLAILDAFIHSDIGFKHGGRLLAICGVNLIVAMLIGLTIMNVFTPGESWSGHVQDLSAELQPELTKTPVKAAPEGVTLNPLKNFSSYIPENMVEPFVKNNVVSVILLALFFGSALRHAKLHPFAADNAGVDLLAKIITTGYHLLMQMLAWVVLAVPFAITGVVAMVVGKSGLGVFTLLGVFLATMMAGLLIHAFIYYPCLAQFVGKVPIKRRLGHIQACRQRCRGHLLALGVLEHGSQGLQDLQAARAGLAPTRTRVFCCLRDAATDHDHLGKATANLPESTAT
jgi:Na+/H+-dicarboxylate symporter